MTPAAALLMAAFASTPMGSLRTQAVYTDYSSQEACEAALVARATADRAAPISAGTSASFDGPVRDGEGRLAYRLTLIVTGDGPTGGAMQTAYVYEHVCEGARDRFIADGWVRTAMSPPPPLIPR